MKKLMYKKISHVLMVLGAKKKEVLEEVYESENAINLFLNPGELPPVIQASNEISDRFNRYMLLEADVDGWLEKRHTEMSNGVTDLNELKNVIHKDMLNFVQLIENI
ncbi:MAG: hypothetical protein WDZ35_12495 [Crocinitomicaceae bacterium]